MVAEELEPLWGGSSILARAEGELEPEGWVLGPRIGGSAAAYGGAVAFRGSQGPQVRVHDGFQMLSGLSDAPTLVAGTVLLSSSHWAPHQHRAFTAAPYLEW